MEQSGGTLKDVIEFLGKIPWYAWIAIVGTIGGVTVAIVQASQRHAERMAMIERGMNPDAPGRES